MAIEFDCPACDATIRVKDDAAGKKGRCPRCKVLLLVPDPGPEDELESEQEPEHAPEAPHEPRVDLPPSPATLEEAPTVISTSEPVAAPIVDVTSKPPAVASLPPTPVERPTPLELPTAVEQSTPVEEPVEDDLVVVSTPGPTPLPVVDDSPMSRVGRHTTRKGSRRRSSNGPLSAVIGVIAFLVLAGGAWFAYQMTLPDVPDVITGERYRSIGLPPARIAAPGSDAVTSDVREPVLKNLASGGLPLKSGFVEVWLSAEGEELVVEVSPGPRSNAVRVPLGELESIRALLSRERDRIASLKSRELRRSTADFFRDYAAYLDEGTAMTRLPEYRDDVALNAASGVTGYAVEAIVGSTPFLCVYEDSTGGCYFFPPKETQKFQIRGRKLPDGSTPLPIEIDVIVKDAKGGPPIEEDDADKPKPADEAETDAKDEKAETDAKDVEKENQTDPAEDGGTMKATP